LLRLTGHADYDLAVPTPDHFVPLLYIAGLAAAENSKPELLVRGHTMGSISMACYGLGAQLELRKNAHCAAMLPEGVPPDQTNMCPAPRGRDVLCRLAFAPGRTQCACAGAG